MRQRLNRKGPQRIDPSTIQKILLIRLRRMGDVIMTTPAISALRESLPQAYIAYVVEEPYRELVENHPSLDETIIIPKDQSFIDFLKLIQKIRKEKLDAVIDFHGGPRASFMTLFSKAKLKVGYRIKYKNFFYHIKLTRSPKNGYIHSVENHMNLVKALGLNITPSPSLSLPQSQKKEVEKVKKFFSENKLDRRTIIVLHISAGNEFRNWGVNNLIELSNLFLQKKGIQIILIGSREDQGAEKEIQKRSKASLLSLVGQLNLRELKELISYSSLFIGPDSGPMHIAAATSTPIVAYFGPTLPAHFAPWKAKAIMIEKEFACRPCKQRRCIYEDFRCLRSIKPEDIYKASLHFI